RLRRRSSLPLSCSPPPWQSRQYALKIGRTSRSNVGGWPAQALASPPCVARIRSIQPTLRIKRSFELIPARKRPQSCRAREHAKSLLNIPVESSQSPSVDPGGSGRSPLSLVHCGGARHPLY